MLRVTLCVPRWANVEGDHVSQGIRLRVRKKLRGESNWCVGVVVGCPVMA